MGTTAVTAAQRRLPSLAELARQLGALAAEVAGVAVEAAEQPLLQGGLDSLGAVELRWALCSDAVFCILIFLICRFCINSLRFPACSAAA
jgi:hypothetical protein